MDSVLSLLLHYTKKHIYKICRDFLSMQACAAGFALKKTKFYGLSPRANYTDRATASCRRSDCQLFADEGCHVVSVTDPYGRISVF
jgi:hypothetical protein